MTNILVWLYIKLRGDVVMLAMLYATRIIAGKTAFAAVPATLRAEVTEILLDAGVPELAE